MIVKKLFWTIAILVCCHKLQAQDVFAVIKDPDGFVNVHEGDLQSKVTGKILKYQPFDSFEGDKEYQKHTGMAYVEYDQFIENTKDHVFYNKGHDSLPPTSGYIHKSRIYKLDNMPKLKLISLKANKAVYGNSFVTVEIEIANFDLKKHVVKDTTGKLLIDKTSCDVATIDGIIPWGSDMFIPKKEIVSIKLMCSDTSIVLPQASIKNLYDPNIESDYTSIHIGSDNEIYIWMKNGDAAGSHNVIWVLVDKKLRYRFTRLSYFV